MEFHPREHFSDNNKVEQNVWKLLRNILKDEEGVAYYRYPVFCNIGRDNKEPDFLIVHRELGLWVIESKSLKIEQIVSIQGHEWKCQNYYKEYEKPIWQAKEQMFTIKNKLDLSEETRYKIRCDYRVALPNITKEEWENSEFSKNPATENRILTRDDLSKSAFKKHLLLTATSKRIEEEDWKNIQRILGTIIPSPEPRNIPTGTPSDNPIRVIKAIETELKTLDETQQKVAFEIPPGPQRLRGLAGTGKTVLLVKKAVKAHIKNPEWTIGFLFFTHSLYQEIKKLITSYHKQMHPNNAEPNWDKLKILHGWGGNYQSGFYSELAKECGISPKDSDDVKDELEKRWVQPTEGLEYICESLKEEVEEIPQTYDMLIIDEGHDFGPVFYQLAYETLSEPKRLYWAYDEAQSLGSLIIPQAATIFGRDEEGDLIVDLSGSYEGGIFKSHIMKKCYRTPRNILMAAHAINMGLFREGGALQGISRKDEWEILGYEVIEGNFNKVGRPVTITRPDENSPHPIDREDFKLKDAVGDNFIVKTFYSEDEEREWIASEIAKDIKAGFKPEDILITTIHDFQMSQYFNKMVDVLEEWEIKTWKPVREKKDTQDLIFKKEGCVTISNIFYAKGNEAWKVYIPRFHLAGQKPKDRDKTELHKRNEGFVALTRTRLWAVVTGLNTSIFDELERAIEQYPNFTFPAFNKSSLERVTDD